MSDSLKNEPFLISHLVRIATLQLNASAIREGLHRHVWNDSQLAELQKKLAPIDLFAEFREAMRAERAWGVIGMEEMINKKTSIDVLGYFESNADVNKNRRTKEILFNAVQYSSCIFYQNMMCLSTWEQIIIDSAVDIKQHRINVDMDEIMMKKLSGIKKNPFNFIAGMLVPSVTQTYMKAGRGQTTVDCGMVAIAIERYQLKNGKLPNTLNELVPIFIDKIPTDVIDGKPLRYCQMTEGGYTLYSIGYNKVDDGGVTGFNKKGSPDYKIGDWAYPMPLK